MPLLPFKESPWNEPEVGGWRMFYVKLHNAWHVRAAQRESSRPLPKARVHFPAGAPPPQPGPPNIMTGCVWWLGSQRRRVSLHWESVFCKPAQRGFLLISSPLRDQEVTRRKKRKSRNVENETAVCFALWNDHDWPKNTQWQFEYRARELCRSVVFF